MVELFETTSDQKKAISMYHGCQNYQGKYVARLYGYGELWIENGISAPFVVLQDLNKHNNVVDFRNAKQAQSAFIALQRLLKNTSINKFAFDNRHLALDRDYDQVMFSRFDVTKRPEDRYNWSAFGQLWNENLLTESQIKTFHHELNGGGTSRRRVSMKLKKWMHISRE